jgi:hypothetical protein
MTTGTDTIRDSEDIVLSTQASEALEFLECLEPDSPFSDLLDCVLEDSFHEGGDDPNVLAEALKAQILEQGRIRQGLIDTVEDAIYSGYGFRRSDCVDPESEGFVDMDESVQSFDLTSATAILKVRLEELGPRDTVYSILKDLVVEGIDLREQGRIDALKDQPVPIEQVLQWAKSDEVLRILEEHFAKIGHAYITEQGAELLANSPVEQLRQYFRDQTRLQLQKDRSTRFKVRVSAHLDVMNSPSFRNAINSVYRKWSSGKYPLFGSTPNPESLRAYFIHALREVKRDFITGDNLRRSLDSRIIKALEDDLDRVQAFFRIGKYEAEIAEIFEEIRSAVFSRKALRG